MEQIEFITQKLQIVDFPTIVTDKGTLKAPHIIMLCVIGSFILSLFGIYNITYLTLAFGLPAICRYKNIKIFNYWECLALLLYFRTLSDSFQTLDGIFCVLLWHPNFRWGQKIVEVLLKYKQEGHIDKVVTQIKKKL